VTWKRKIRFQRKRINPWWSDRSQAALLCGSRDWTDEDAVREQLDWAVARFGTASIDELSRKFGVLR
jgi:hypothetical protein